jgi:hypothetical protein
MMVVVVVVVVVVCGACRVCVSKRRHTRGGLLITQTPADELPGENQLDVPSEAEIQEVSYNTSRAKSFPQVLPVPFHYWECERGKLTVGRLN